MTDLATHLAKLEPLLARFRDKGILYLIDGKGVSGGNGSRPARRLMTA